MATTETFVAHPTKCKFCGCEITVRVSTDYHLLGDPYGLLKLACCNHCADLRDRRRSLHEQFIDACAQVQLENLSKAESREEAFKVFSSLVKRYITLIKDWTGRECAFDEEMPNAFIYNPKHCGKHLGKIWQLTKQQQLL